MASSQSQEAIAAIDAELKTILKKRQEEEKSDSDTDTEIHTNDSESQDDHVSVVRKLF